ncbi:MAG: thiamine pyrophosphate-dependent enzyme [Acidimicrobiales bacterium]|jgi:transketolase
MLIETKPDKEGYGSLRRLMSLMTGDERHDPSATSTLDVLWVLYDRVMRPSGEDRDRFLLSKGHGPQAFFAVLAAKGYFEESLLPSFGEFDSPFGHHPDHLLVPGVEISSGSLGHGLAMACGLALGLRLARSDARVFCLVGDAEMDEGSNHEAIALADRFGLAKLTAIVIDNHSASHGWPGGIERRFEVEGWSATRVDGRDHDSIEAALCHQIPGRPGVVVAETEPKR